MRTIGARLVAVALAVASALTSTACGGAGGALPPSTTTVAVAMKDYRFDFDTRGPHRGRIVFRVTNEGPHFHQMAIIPLPEDLPPIRQQVQGGSRAAVSLRASTPPLAPHRTDVVAVDLTPGRWGFVCFVSGPEGNHASKGMAAEFRIV